MALNQDKSRLDRLQKNLYSRNENLTRKVDEGTLTRHSYAVKDDWGDKENIDGPRPSLAPRPIITKLLYFSLLFFVVAVSLAMFIYFRGVNVVSSDNIEITIAGPLTIRGGEELKLDVTVKNENNTDLELADLKVEYPDGTRNPDDVTVEQKRTLDPIGDIVSGQSVKKRVRAVLFGEENAKKQLTVAVEYRLKGSNAIFEKEKKFDIIVSSAPVNVVITSLKEVNSNQDIEFVADITSNSSQLIRNILFKVEYPFGFTYKEASPAPYANKDIWLIGDLKPGEKRTVKIRGKVEGQDGDVRTFRYSIGVQGVKNDTALEPVFLTTQQTITINKPFIGVNLALDGKTDNTYTSRVGSSINGVVAWVNNLPTRITGARVEVKITGPILDKQSVRAEQGFYDSSRNVVLWEKTTMSELAVLNPGDSGRGNFSFATLLPNVSALAAYKNQELTLEVSVKGKRSDDAQVPEEVLSTMVKKVRITSEINITPQLMQKTGPLSNKGSVPPIAEKETTYTVVWALTNSLNDVRDVKATASLPPYVTWLNIISPTTEKISMTPEGKIVWDVGEMKAGTGYTTSPRRVYFQVSFVPSLSQVGTAPTIVSDVKIEGVDRFSGAAVGGNAPAINTKLTGEPGTREADEIVTK